MKTKHLLITSLVILSIVFIGLQLMQYEMLASFTRASILILLVLIYGIKRENINNYFFMFLATFALADLIGLSYWYFISQPETSFDYVYFICNSLYILSYLFLIIKVLKSIDIKDVIIKLPAHIVILLVLDIFCVTIVTDTTKAEFDVYHYAMEFLYNTVIMSLLTLSVINYIYKVGKKAMNLLVGSLFIVFSETIQLTYYYILEDNNLLNVLCSLFFIIAFLFFYVYSNQEETEELQLFNEQIEA